MAKPWGSKLGKTSELCLDQEWQNSEERQPPPAETAARVTSSWIDIEAGLAKSGILRTPPDFCASAKWLPSQSASAVAARRESYSNVSSLPLRDASSTGYL